MKSVSPHRTSVWLLLKVQLRPTSSLDFRPPGVSSSIPGGVIDGARDSYRIPSGLSQNRAQFSFSLLDKSECPEFCAYSPAVRGEHRKDPYQLG